MPSLDSLNDNNTKIKTSSLGEIELKYISGGDYQEFIEIIGQNIPDSETTKRILYQQLKKPEISFDKFSNTPDIEIEAMLHAFRKNESSSFGQYVDTGHPYKDFTQALKTDIEEQRQRLRIIAKPAFLDAQVALVNFNTRYESILGENTKNLVKLSESMGKMSKIDIKPFLKIHANLEPIIREQIGLANSITRSLAPQIEIWKKWTVKNNDLFAGTAKVLSEFNAKYQVAEQDTVTVLEKYKWFISPNIPLPLIFEVQKLSKKTGRQDKAVNQLFIGYFESNDWQALENMAAGWSSSPYLKSRYKIISDCVLSVREGSKAGLNMSNVVLPTLIVQIDGIVNDYMEDKGLVHTNYTDRRNTLEANPMPVELPSQLDDLASEVFLNILFQSARTGVPLNTPFNFNRHKILHAENISYGRKDYMIRAFMVLDLLSSLR